jgi:hypothetical protein
MPVVAKAQDRNIICISSVDVLAGLHVSWAFNGLSSAHDVKFYLRKHKGPEDSQAFTAYANDDGTVALLLPPSVLVPLVGKSLCIWAQATKDGCVTRSCDLHLRVKGFRSKDLPRPEVRELSLEDCIHWLDLRQLEGDAHVDLVPWPLVAKAQRVWLRCVGQRPDQAFTFLYLLKSHELSEQEARSGLSVNIPRWWLDSLQDDSPLEIKTEVSYDGALAHRCAHRFPRSRLQVRAAPIHLPAPEVVEAQAGVLDPRNVIDGATVRIDWPGLRTTDWNCLYWGDLAVECKAPVQDGSMVFHVSAEIIRQSFGRSIDIAYSLVRDGRLSQSPATWINVLELDQLPPLVVEQAVAGVLDLNTFVQDARLTIAAWPFAIASDLTWLRICGEKDDGTPLELPVRTAQPLSDAEVAQGVSVLLARDQLQQFANDSLLTVQFHSSFNASIDPARAKAFPPLVLSLITQRFTDTEDFAGLPNELISAGQRITSVPTMDIDFLSGAGEAGIFTYTGNVSGMREGASITLCLNQGDLVPPQRLRLTFRHGYLQLRFAWTWAHLTGKIYSYDAQGAELGVMEIRGLNFGGAAHQWIELSAPRRQRIFSIEVELGDYSFLDNFEMIR